jgi:hypothetical protein
MLHVWTIHFSNEPVMLESSRPCSQKVMLVFSSAVLVPSTGLLLFETRGLRCIHKSNTHALCFHCWRDSKTQKNVVCSLLIWQCIVGTSGEGEVAIVYSNQKSFCAILAIPTLQKKTQLHAKFLLSWVAKSQFITHWTKRVVSAQSHL